MIGHYRTVLYHKVKYMRTLSFPETASETNSLMAAVLSSLVGGLNLSMSSPSLMKRTVGKSSALSPKNSKMRVFSSLSVSR